MLTPISSNDFGVLLACLLSFGQAILLDATAVALKPRWRYLRTQPVWSHFRQHIERVSQRLANQLQAVEGTNSREHVR